MRESTVSRATKETEIDVALRLEGSGQSQVQTGIGMLDHMLEQLAKHGGFDLRVRASGDLHVDEHHTVEDIGLALGQAFDEALGDRAGVARMADRTVPLDDALVQVALDLSGRPYAAIGLEFRRDTIGELPASLAKHFLHSFAQEARLALHVRQLAGENDHHILEAAFKALARALRDAVRIVEEEAGSVPSTKGTLRG
ncbi:MAG: imidazoleglycerol-phosphate dehydratase HisB [Dehalococcoidia bacterium]